MFSRELLGELYRHMEWADVTVWRAVLAHGSSDPRLRDWLVHLHLVQRAFLQVWTGRPVREVLRKPEEFASLDDVRAWSEPYYPEAHAFLSSVTADRLAAPLELPWAARLVESLGRTPEATSLGETCFQVASHSTYHRGQVNARLREIGGEPPLVDYIAWLWLGRPAPERGVS